MKKIILVISVIAACVPVYGVTKKKKQAANEIVSISMSRTVCFGFCPDYTIEMKKDGTTTYTARRFNEDTGIFRKNIGSKKAAAIFSKFTEYRVDTCSEMYENRIPDLPGLNYVIKYKNKTQKIFNASFGPAYLVELAETMDQTGKKAEKTDRTWKKIGMPKFE